MAKNFKILVKNTNISLFTIEKQDYISLTDIARFKDKARSDYIIQNWLRNRDTIEFLGLWEKINNSNFKSIEFDVFKNNAGLNSFSLTPKRWIEKTMAIGLVSKRGRVGGTYAHKDIAFEFASWLSAEFKLFLIKEFQRLKDQESERLRLGWDVKRTLSKVNYLIHTDAIRKYLIPPSISKKKEQITYANEADVLNVALYGMTAKDWRDKNSGKVGNIRDYSDVTQLVVLANLEGFNAEFIKQKLRQSERLELLNKIAISQMKSLVDNKSIKKLKI